MLERLVSGTVGPLFDAVEDGLHWPQVRAWLQGHAKDEANLLWLPINSRKASLTMLVDAETGAVVDALPIDPE